MPVSHAEAWNISLQRVKIGLTRLRSPARRLGVTKVVTGFSIPVFEIFQGKSDASPRWVVFSSREHSKLLADIANQFAYSNASLLKVRTVLRMGCRFSFEVNGTECYLRKESSAVKAKGRSSPRHILLQCPQLHSQLNFATKQAKSFKDLPAYVLRPQIIRSFVQMVCYCHACSLGMPEAWTRANSKVSVFWSTHV